ncbi:AbgT family transporter [Photobacterium carnosum]|uniref:AbgT family transporter n=1 Tax=Photobacterium carnosum TaxID=2023717 RepID=UPI0022B7CA0F|nr:AbgT family transporter [Photobacterium carnosum]
MTTSIQKVPSQKRNWLDNIENVGNKIPDITMLFFCATLFCIALSMVLSWFTFDYIHPLTKEPIQVINLLTPNELMSLFTSMTKNFINFPPLGIVIVATLGIGIAEAIGLHINSVKEVVIYCSSFNCYAFCYFYWYFIACCF